MTTQDLHDLTPAYALDALDDDERATYEAHLRECDDCRAELASLGDTVAALASASEGPLPAPDLRNRIVSAARAERPNVVALRPRRARMYTATAASIAAACALAIGLYYALSESSPGRQVAVSIQPSGKAQAVFSGFEPAPDGKIYEIWMIKGAASPVPVGVFEGARAERAVITLERPVPKGATVAITLERGRVSRPTTRILASTTV